MFRHFVSLWLAVIIISGTLAYLVYAGRESRSQANAGLRTFICFFQDAALHPQNKPPPVGTQKVFIEHFFSNVLTAIHQPPCAK
jgi:hypothetical protein